MTWKIIEGDCVEAMAAMPDGSVDAVVCDPPYGLEFMGKGWDGADGFRRTLNAADTGREDVFGRASRTSPEYRAGRLFGEWCELWAREALRVLKPGGHLLAFGGTRTYHRLTCAVEDAGFEIRDCLAWLYGSGFPKSLDVSKAIDKAAGAEREVVGLSAHAANRTAPEGYEGWTGEDGRTLTAPATPDAERWQGWGTALKPAHEPIVLARKPLAGTVAGNVLATGCGALNVDACRVGTGEGGGREGESSAERRYTDNGSTNFAPTPGPRGGDEAGRWPANVLLDPEAARMLDQQTGNVGGNSVGADPAVYSHPSEGWGGIGLNRKPFDYGDSGGASRFFYVAKASSAERNAGDLQGARNSHPTVKPIELMRWLVRLITPPGGTVLDPFTGSGTTGCAAILDGFDFVGIEREQEYTQIARARIEWWQQHPDGLEIVKALEWDRKRKKVTDTGQMGLL